MRTIAVAVSLAIASAAAGEETSAALRTLIQAAKTPAQDAEQVKAARKALRALAKHKPPGAAEVAQQFAVDERQAEAVRGEAFLTLAQVPDAPVEQVQALVVPLVPDQKAPRLLRIFAATALRHERVADDRVRQILKAVLLRPEDDHVLQRTCLGAFARTASLKRIRSLLLRPKLAQHPYHGIRVDVCAGLAALNVRDRRALDILCTLMTDDDPHDKQLLVPREAWLSFWALTGRTHGLRDKAPFTRRTVPLGKEEDIRRHLWAAAMLRPGVTPSMVGEVDRFVCANYDAAAAAKAHRRPIKRVRNKTGLHQAAALSRGEFDAIEAEWAGAR